MEKNVFVLFSGDDAELGLTDKKVADQVAKQLDWRVKKLPIDSETFLNRVKDIKGQKYFHISISQEGKIKNIYEESEIKYYHIEKDWDGYIGQSIKTLRFKEKQIVYSLSIELWAKSKKDARKKAIEVWAKIPQDKFVLKFDMESIR